MESRSRSLVVSIDESVDEEEEITMNALLAYSTSASPVLEEVAPPELGPADVRIRVAAAAVNPVDVGVLTGPVRALTGLPDPVGLGWDVSGTVSEVGGDVSGLQPGDRVAGILHVIGLKPSVGTHADETVLPAAAVARIPDGLDLVEAATLPLNALTASQAIDLFGPAEGRTLLITGGAGAVGGHAIVLAARAGWRVTALARDADADFVVRAGAEPVTELPGPSFDAVLDAAVLLESALAAVRDGGSFVGVAPGSPVAAERGITVHTVSVEPDGEAIAGLLALASESTLELRVAGKVPLRDAAEAFEKVAGGGQRGRWLLIP
jgi:NADPH:quinone reductase-like Zn-dependent oxidoreductase